jgi:acylaminoacyl-peptidase
VSKREITPEDLLRLVFVGDPQPSPDGSSILFQRKRIDDRMKYQTSLWTVTPEGETRPITQEKGGAGHGRWSPDGNWIAFLGDREESGSQIYLISTLGGEAQPLTALAEGSIGEYIFSPDGTKIAFTYRPAMPEFTRDAKKAREVSGGSEPAMAFDHIWYRLDGDGYFAGQRFAIYVLDVPSAPGFSPVEATRIYDEDAHGDYSFDWHPDGSHLIVAHSASKYPFRDLPNEQLYRVNLDGTATQIPGLPAGQKSAPRYSPDGQWIAYAGDVDETDPWGTRNTKIYLVPAAGGSSTDLTGGTDLDMAVATLSDSAEASFGAKLKWHPDGSGLFVEIGTFGTTQIGFVPVEGGVALLTEGHHAIKMGGLFPDGRIAGTVSTPTQLGEVCVVEPELVTGRRVAKLLTSFNQAFQEEVLIREPEEHWVPTTDGLKVHTWVIRGAGDGPRPGALNIHGGPHTQYGWTFFHELQTYAAAGYTVVYSNPRGSKGYGEAWCAAIKGDWGNKDWDDIQAVRDFMKADPDIDSSRLGVMGGSYGGYMTNWAIGHTTDFACAITDRCVSNMVSMAGNSDFPFNKDGYFKGVAWGSLEKISELWRQSPIAYFENVKTPTLVIHSVGDLRCNVEQSEQVFTALQMEGVPSRFVRYPASTSHGLSRSGPPDLRLHRLGEYLDWMKKYLG